jgi:hypothetical protein
MLQLKWGTLLTFSISYVSWVPSQLDDRVFPLFLEFWWKLRMQILCNGLPETWADSSILIYIHYLELMKSVGSHGSLSLLFMMKVMVWDFVSNSHKLWLHSSMCYLKLLVEISLQFHVEVCWHAYSWGKVMNLIFIFNYLKCFVHQMYACPCCTMDAKECLVQWEFAHNYLFQPNQRKGLSRFVYNDLCFQSC